MFYRTTTFNRRLNNLYPQNKSQTEKQRDRKTKRQREKETERQRDRETERQRDKETERQGKRKTEKDRKTNIYILSLLGCVFPRHTVRRSHSRTKIKP